MDAVHTPTPGDPGGSRSPAAPRRPRRRVEHPIAASILLLGWIAMTLQLLVGVRQADGGDLRQAVAHQRVAVPDVVHRRPDGFSQWLRLPPPLDDDDDDSDTSGSCTATDGSTVDCSSSDAEPNASTIDTQDVWLVWHDGPGNLGERWMPMGEAAKALGTRDTTRSVMASIHRNGVAGGSTWSLPGLVGLCLVFTIVAGARPRTGTRWFWFWVAWLPAGMGLLWYVAAECWSGRTPARRRSGWWGILVAVVLRTAVVGGFGLDRSHP